MRVLFVNHTGAMSGGERSLIELLGALPDDVSAALAAPSGPLAAAAREQGVAVATIPAAEASLRLHARHTPIALAGLARASLAVRRLARRYRADLIHANSVRAGLVASFAQRLGGPPVVTYVHDCLPQSRVANLIRRVILSADGAVLANSRYAAEAFARGTGGADVRTAYNGMLDESGRLVSLGGIEPPRRDAVRSELGLEDSVPLLGVVAQITPWKGQDVAVEALASVRRKHPDARLLLVGEAKFTGAGTRFDNRAYLDRVRARAAELGVVDSIEFLGERADALAIIGALDVLLAPSWEEPFGRTIVEAMALGTPVVATEVGGPAEMIEDGITGRLVPPRRPDVLADAVLELLAKPELRARFAIEGRSSVARFSRAAHVEQFAAQYRALLAAADCR